jgi:D-glycero-D-manno-heptose 1,7-bisphosphate phosphatase
MSLKLAIFDRDNTLVRVPPGTRYVYGLDPIVFLPGVAAALRHLTKRGITCVVATNQQGVSMNEFPLMTSDSVEMFNQRLREEVAKLGGRIDRFYVCPHLDTEGCDCRKPRPGLFIEALQDFKVEPNQAVGIGNSQRDNEAARAAGICAIAVPCPTTIPFDANVPTYHTLLHAVRSICGGSGQCGRLEARDS